MAVCFVLTKHAEQPLHPWRIKKGIKKTTRKLFGKGLSNADMIHASEVVFKLF